MHVHTQDHQPEHYGNLFIIGITLNIGYVAIEAFYGWHIQSLALLADAGHNLGDVAGLVLAWLSMLAARLNANDRHTYGWKKGTIIASFLNASLLLIAMGALAWEAIGRFDQITVTEGSTIMWVAGVGVVINGVTAWLFFSGSQTDLNIRGAFLHMAADALVSLGVVISGALYLQWQWNWLDPMVSLIIVVVVVISTWSLFYKSLHLLFDGVPDNIDATAVKQLLGDIPNVISVHDLHIWAMSTTQNALSVHVVIADGELDRDHLLEQISKQLHQQENLNHITVQVESEDAAENCLLMHCIKPEPAD
jgi:cobalt-zinc-cadmium efflux system protein